MAKALPTQENEVDYFEILQTFWDGRWKIISIAFILVLIGIVLNASKPNSFKTVVPFLEGSKSEFLPYTIINELMIENSFPLRINKTEVFNLFISKFNSYDDLLETLRNDEYVKEAIKDLDAPAKQKALNKFAKLFELKPPSKNVKTWIVSFRWHDADQGLKILDDTTQKILNNIQASFKKDFESVALTIEIRNLNELENLRSQMSNISDVKILEDKKRIRYLTEQADIARSLGIKSNTLSTPVLNQSSKETFSVNLHTSNKVPYYLRGFLAIEKEKLIIEERMASDSSLMAEGYLQIYEKILSLENDLTSTQLKVAIEYLSISSPLKWVDIAFRHSKVDSLNKPKLIVVYLFLLGAMLGVFYVFILYLIRKQRDKMLKRQKAFKR